MQRNLSILTHESDNVAIVVDPRGLDKGAVLEDGTELLERVPFGHKAAIVDFEQGEKIIRYGVPIGTARRKIERGSWVKESVMEILDAPRLEDLDTNPKESAPLEPLEGYTFEGYRNPDGSVGTKNMLGVTTSVQCVAGVVDYAVDRIKKDLLPLYPNVDGVVALNHVYGCGIAISAPGAEIPIRTIRNLAMNPNFGGEIMVIGLGCEKLQPQTLLQGAKGETTTLSLQDEQFQGFTDMLEGILAQAKEHLERLNKRQRETCPISDLVVGVQCGGSDAFSGITANPAVGFASDLIVRAGGSVIFSEVTEVRDGIHLLTPRAQDSSVAKALIHEMAWYDHYLDHGQMDRSSNPSPGNKKGGLSNIVEKTMGSIAKSGSSPIVDVISHGERVRKKGLTFGATPAGDFVCGTLQLAAGMNLHVFTTGRGTPYNLEVAPVIKVATNSVLGQRWSDIIDIDAGKIASGDASISDVGWELFRLMIEVASGRELTAADKLGISNQLALFNPAPLT